MPFGFGRERVEGTLIAETRVTGTCEADVGRSRTNVDDVVGVVDADVETLRWQTTP